MKDPATVPPDGTTTHAVVLLVRDTAGVTIAAVLDGQRYGPPVPVSDRKARAHLRLICPWIFEADR